MTGGRLPLGRWVAACAAAEAIGMTASAAASGLAQGATPAVALTMIVAGGLIEGVALGVLQSMVLARWLPALRRNAWAIVTVVIAGLGWAAASAPSQWGDPDGAEPSVGWVLAGAAGLGAAMGALLGAAQAAVLRGVVPHPMRWIGVSAIAWTPAMVVIFLGATAPDANWSRPVVIVLGTATGALAGALLGLVSGILSPWIVGASAANGVALDLLQSRWHGLLGGSILGLKLHGRRTGRVIELPVQYAPLGDDVVVYPNGAQKKEWWRNLLEPAEVEMLIGGRWQPGTGRVVTRSDPGWAGSLEAYGRRWPRIRIDADSPLVVIERAASR